MKQKLLKKLRSCSAHWIGVDTYDTEPIISLLITKWGHHSSYDVLTKYAKEKGWVTSQTEGVYEKFYFTEKGRDEILIPLQETTCITGRTVR